MLQIYPWQGWAGGLLPSRAILQAVPLTPRSARPSRDPAPTLCPDLRPSRAPACGFPCRVPTGRTLASRLLQVRPRAGRAEGPLGGRGVLRAQAGVCGERWELLGPPQRKLVTLWFPGAGCQPPLL